MPGSARRGADRLRKGSRWLPHVAWLPGVRAIQALAAVRRLQETPWTELSNEEAAARRDILRAARECGPLNTLHRVAKGELGGPLTQALVTSAPGIGVFRSRWRYRLFAGLGPLFFGSAVLALTQAVLSGRAIWLRICVAAVSVVAAIVAGGAVYLLALRPTRGKVLRFIAGWSREDLLSWALLVIVVPTVAFGAITAVLIDRKLIGVSGVTPSDSGLALKAAETYAWNLADAVPVLKVPETLNWKPTMKLTTVTGGALVLGYKCLLVLPLAETTKATPLPTTRAGHRATTMGRRLDPYDAAVAQHCRSNRDRCRFSKPGGRLAGSASAIAWFRHSGRCVAAFACEGRRCRTC
jgi:hypothetical protein